MLVPSLCDFIVESDRDRSGATLIGGERFIPQAVAMAQLMAKYSDESVLAMTGITRDLFTYTYITYCGSTSPVRRSDMTSIYSDRDR
jgi:hypothetical protein